jgi:glycosyltransferase involved in cell wall biosynthesis
MARRERGKGRLGRGRLRILIVIENVPLARDHRARKQVQSLLEAGYDVSVICRKDAGNAPYRGSQRLRLYEYPPPGDAPGKLSFAIEYGYSWLAATALALKAFLHTGFGAIQAGHPPDIYSFLALPFKIAGRSFVVDQRDLSPEMYLARYGSDAGPFLQVLQALERLSWRVADHVLCVNESLRSMILHRGAVSAEKVTVVGNGPVLSRTVSRPQRPELKKGRKFLACWVGLMGPQDHVELVLWAVHHLVHTLRRDDCHFSFIGEGEALPTLRELAARLEIEDWITFTGWLDEDACFDYLASSDVGLDSNQQHEVTPVKGMEYMAFGLPLVAFDLKETRAMAGDAAVYVDPGDAMGLAQSIGQLLDDPVRRREMAMIGRRRVEESLAWDRQKDAYLQVYERLLPRPLGDGARPATSLTGLWPQRSTPVRKQTHSW